MLESLTCSISYQLGAKRLLGGMKLNMKPRKVIWKGEKVTWQRRKSRGWQVGPRWRDPHRRRPQRHRWRWISGWGPAPTLRLSWPSVCSPSSFHPPPRIPELIEITRLCFTKALIFLTCIPMDLYHKPCSQWKTIKQVATSLAIRFKAKPCGWQELVRQIQYFCFILWIKRVTIFN